MTDEALKATQVFSVAGKRALVTGASSGLGVRFARVLAAWGAEVVIAARRLDRLQAVAEEIRQAGGKVQAVAMDVTDPASVAAGLERAGRIDILVNNAGIAGNSPLLRTSDEEWRRVLDVTLDSAFRVARETAKGMAEAGGGVIVNIASVLSFEVQARVGTYAVAKSGVAQVTRTLAIELARKNIRVNALAPGYFESEMTAAYFASDAGKQMIRGLPLGRAGTPADLDGMLLLLSSDAGSYMTGAVVLLDGGQSLLMP